MKTRLRLVLPGVVVLLALALTLNAAAAKPPPGGGATITVSGTQWGLSSAFIGATEGNVRFDVADMTDCGINTYRVYGGMSRWEAQDDDGVYGSPSIAEIKANPGVINWTWWDNIMTTPPDGDYWWSADPGTGWQGNARTIFNDLKNAGIKPVVTLRNVDNNDRPTWAPNPPTVAADWNEWWEHVFATVYWFNVRNNYNVDDWQVHNEPNNGGQGWAGTETDYYEFVRQTSDAIRYVYATYLPGRTPRIYAPVCYNWLLNTCQQVPTYFNAVDIHNYQSDITGNTQQAHTWMNSTACGGYPLWMSEWCTYRDNYGNAGFCVQKVVNNLMRASRPGNDHVDGSHIFTFYDWDGFSGAYQNFTGLVHRDGSRNSGFYAMRISCRALAANRPVYQATCSNSYMMAMGSKDAAGKVYLLATNIGAQAVTADVNLSALITNGTGTMWQYDDTHNDVIVGSPALAGGHVSITVPGNTAVLLKF